MLFNYSDEYLNVRPTVILNDNLKASISGTRPYFFKYKHHSEVTSGIRTAEDQLNNVIVFYADHRGIQNEFPEFQLGSSMHWGAVEKVNASDDVKTEFGLQEVYWWQTTWSRLLHHGVICNPPIKAMCLEDSLRPDGTNRRGVVIDESPHSKKTAWDIGGGSDLDGVMTILEEATDDPKSLIRSLTKEHDNNAVHVNIKIIHFDVMSIT